jgi:predicted lysophospholipase L1 biosynthesis ABC-type transport system permease subunit
MNARPTPWTAHVVMWTAIGLSIALLGVLLALGWDDGAWATAAGALLIACIAVCVVAVLQSRSTDREVRRAIERLAAARATETPHRPHGDQLRPR